MPLVEVIRPEIMGFRTGPLICNETEPTRSAKIVFHNQGVAALDSQPGKARRSHQRYLTAFLDRLFASIDEIGQLNVFGVFGAMQVN